MIMILYIPTFGLTELENLAKNFISVKAQVSNGLCTRNSVGFAPVLLLCSCYSVVGPFPCHFYRVRFASMYGS